MRDDRDAIRAFRPVGLEELQAGALAEAAEGFELARAVAAFRAIHYMGIIRAFVQAFWNVAPEYFQGFLDSYQKMGGDPLPRWAYPDGWGTP